ncbi:MAG: transcription antitermination factor NusB [Saprospiraceae bacterium]
MQTLYAQSRDKELNDKDVLKYYQHSIDGTIDLFLFNLYLLIEITKVSVEDESNIISKYLTTVDDKLFKSTLYHNDIIKGLVNNKDLKSKLEKLNFQEEIDQDVIRKLYKSFSETTEYSDYWHNRKNNEDDQNILLELYRFLRANENFVELIEDKYFQWTSEKSVVIGTVKKIIKRSNFDGNFIESYYPDDDTIKELGDSLLKKCLDIEPELEKYVVPKLLKWDKDRITVIDMDSNKMSLAEVLFFPSIPTNVTLNEYVELSKEFSTDKSKEFINGVMDRVIKDLTEQNLIDKKSSES